MTSAPDARERVRKKESERVELKLDPIHIHLHLQQDPAIQLQLQQMGQALSILLRRTEQIMVTQADAAKQLTDVKDELVKVQSETRGLLDKITELETAVQNAANVSPELQAAVDGVVEAAGTVDSMVPDASQLPPPTGGATDTGTGSTGGAQTGP